MMSSNSEQSKDHALPRLSQGEKGGLDGGRLALFAAVLYFSEGWPYGIIQELVPIFLRQKGVSLTAIGLIAAVASAWTLKFFWSPLVDTCLSYRHWIRATLFSTSAVLALLAFTTGNPDALFWLLLTLLAISSATHDLAVDAFVIVATPPEKLGTINSIRITTYRIAIILGGGGLAAVADRAGWNLAFAVAAGVAFMIFLFSLRLPPVPRRPSERNTLAALREWLGRPGTGAWMALVLLFKLGDVALLPMIKPFWIDRGYSATEVGTATTVIGIAFTIIGAWVAGFLMRRWNIPSALFRLGIVQAFSNVAYAIAASTDSGRVGMYSASVIENFAGGLGTAAFLAFLMSLCDRNRAATEFALLTALLGFTRSAAGAMSGIAAEALGYAGFFWLTVLLGIPGLVLARKMNRQTWPPTLQLDV